MYRMQVYDEHTTGMHWQTHKQGADHYRRFVAEGKTTRMEVAVAIGCDPATMYSAILPLPPDLDEMLVAGFLRGNPRGDGEMQDVDLEVPAESEIVLEGFVNWASFARKGPSAITLAFTRWRTTIRCFTSRASRIGKSPDLRHHHCGPSAHGRFLHGEGDRAYFSAADAAATA